MSQTHLVGPAGVLTKQIKAGIIPSIILWGPPGTGKTTTIINLINAYQEKLNQKNQEQFQSKEHFESLDPKLVQIYQKTLPPGETPPPPKTPNQRIQFRRDVLSSLRHMYNSSSNNEKLPENPQKNKRRQHDAITKNETSS